MKRKIFLALFMTVIAASVFAKRLAPEPIEHVVHEGRVFVADNFHYWNCGGGLVRVYDQKTGKQIKTKFIYFNLYNPFMEKDVQWVEWRAMQLDDDGTLFLQNEMRKSYKMDVENYRVSRW